MTVFALGIGVVGLIVGAGLRLLSESVPDRSGGGRAFLSCDVCPHQQGWVIAIPVVGAWQPCPSCGSQRQRGRVVIDVLTALVFLSLAVRIGASWTLPPMLVFAAALLGLSAIDLERFRLPDRLLFPSIAVAAALLVALSAPGGWTDHLMSAAIGMFAYGFILLLPNLIAPALLGFGDVKLALLLGMFLGWAAASVAEGLILIIWALIAGMIFGILSGIAVGVGRRIFGPRFLEDPDHPISDGEAPPPILRTAVPMGPGLAMGALIVLLWSGTIIEGPALL